MNNKEIIDKIRAEYDRLDNLTGVSTKDVKISLSSRMTRKLGYFSRNKIGVLMPDELKIVISDKIISDQDLFTDVIRHEYAHALVYKRNPYKRHVHDEIWKKAALEVGCSPKASVKNNGSVNWINERPYRYVLICSECKAEYKYKTMSKIVKIALNKNRGKISCPKCNNSNFSVIKLGL